MIGLTVTGTDRIVADFQTLRDATPRALVRALNRSMASARTAMTRAIASDTGLKAGDARSAMVLRNASFSSLTASLTASSKRIPLIQFKARGPEPSRGRGRGVSYQLPGGRNIIPNAFITTVGSGHRGVFVRVGKGRLPIRELFGPSVGRVFIKFRDIGVAKAQETFASNFEHELAFARGGGNVSADVPPEVATDAGAN